MVELKLRQFKKELTIHAKKGTQHKEIDCVFPIHDEFFRRSNFCHIQFDFLSIRFTQNNIFYHFYRV